MEKRSPHPSSLVTGLTGGQPALGTEMLKKTEAQDWSKFRQDSHVPSAECVLGAFGLWLAVIVNTQWYMFSPLMLSCPDPAPRLSCGLLRDKLRSWGLWQFFS